MGLDYLRQTQIMYSENGTVAGSPNGQSEKRLSLGKFTLLLSGNLIVWLIFAVSLLGADALSMDKISKAHLPRKLEVSGIVYNEKNPSAIIEKEVYGIGDVVDGYTIIRITRTEVEFEKNGKKIIRQTR